VDGRGDPAAAAAVADPRVALRVVDDDRAVLDVALQRALAAGEATADALHFVHGLLAGERDAAALPPAARDALFDFVARFQQTSGPATAKGVEDTAIYQYVPLASRNEVGGEPGELPADAPARLHAANAARQGEWPRHLLTVTTHDTKRTADVRARLDVLSELPDQWLAQVERWMERHRALTARRGGARAPDPSTEYLLYQTVLALWPLTPGGAPPDADVLAQLADRVDAYMLKAALEAKSHTSWTDHDADYEQALSDFVRSLLEDEPGAAFRREVAALAAEVGVAGLVNGLARTLVHLTAPGTPDLYQGDELWNFALVDPDNRRPVDYALRARLLDEIAAGAEGAARATLLDALVAAPEDGRLKLLVVHAALAARRDRPRLFTDGRYLPLSAEGPRAAHLFAFARLHEGAAAVTVVPRLPFGLARAADAATGVMPHGEVWAGTTLRLPPELAEHDFVDAIGRRAVRRDARHAGGIPVERILQSCPAALLVSTAG
jgi:(1->4)-alpha-D-glucan 1-alpha-D-glucosylmutase